MLFNEIIPIYSEKLIICGQNAEFLNVKIGVTCKVHLPYYIILLTDQGASHFA
jgi:hypothetical protein